MKRFLSWVVLYLLSLVLRFLAFQYLRLVFYIHGAIYDFSRVLYFIIIYGGGCIGLGVMITGLVAGGKMMMSLSEKVMPSRKGTRYLVLGIIEIVVYLGSIITMIAGIAEDRSLFQYAWHIIMLIFYAIFAASGKAIYNGKET